MRDRHLKEWSLKPSLRQPAISLEASPGGPRRPCPSAGGPPPPPPNRSQWIQSEGLWEQRRRDGRRHAAGRSPRAGRGAVLLQEPEPTLPYVPGPFSAQDLYFPVKSLSCLKLGLVLR